MKSIAITSVLVIIGCFSASGQKVHDAWCFGAGSGLSFTSNVPTSFSSAISTSEGCASIANAQGNLLFYTDGTDIYNKLNAVMANGAGLSGGNSSTQSALIEKVPNSGNLYYVFTVGENGAGQLNYSVVDMSLASGNGSITVKNVSLAVNCSEKLISTRHCNGSDTWVVSHDMFSNTFRSFLLTSSGINSVTIISQVGSVHTGFESYGGNMKISPSGKKLAVAVSGTSGFFELFDFNNSTGVVSNPLKLVANAPYAYGCEFSPNGTKLYGVRVVTSSQFLQWDLCAGDSSAIKNSVYSTNFPFLLGSMQLASNGKIYVARYNGASMGVIQWPNLPGFACGFNVLGQSLGFGSCKFGLPNFNTSRLQFPDPSIVDTILSCNTRKFVFPNEIIQASQSCQSAGRTLQTYLWNFGDIASGALDTSSVLHPTHVYQNPGTYTVSLRLVYECDVIDTVSKILTILPTCSVNIQLFQNCNSQVGTGIVGPGSMMPGPFSCTWMPGALTGTSVSGLLPGNYTVYVHQLTSQSILTVGVLMPIALPMDSLVLMHSDSVLCFGASTATAALYHQGQLFSNWPVIWTNGISTYTGSSVQQLSSGSWTVSVSGYNNYCNYTETFFIEQPTAIQVSVVPATHSVCVNSTVNLQAFCNGGYPFAGGVYSYSWSLGANSSSCLVTSSVPITQTFQVYGIDAFNCIGSASIELTFVPLPSLVVSSISLCAQQVGVLKASGANTYSWDGSQTGDSISVLGTSHQTLLLVGSIGTCSSSAFACVFVYPLAEYNLSSNSPICQNQTLEFYATGALTFLWYGPQSFSSVNQNAQLQNAQPAHSGIYFLQVSDTNACISTSSISVQVNPNPSLTISSSHTVCAGDSICFQAPVYDGWNYTWLGPGSSISLGPTFCELTNETMHTATYTLHFSDSLACSNQVNTHLFVAELPKVEVTETVVCLNAGAILTASGAISYHWEGPHSFSFIGNPLSISSVTHISAESYTVTGISYFGCENTVISEVKTRMLPSPFATADTRVCEKSNVHFSGSGGKSYTWNGPLNFYTTTSSFTLFSVNPSHSGAYTLTVSDEFSCSSSTVISVIVDPSPVLEIVGIHTKDCVPFCAEFSFERKTQEPLVFYEWSVQQQKGRNEKFKPCFEHSGLYSVSFKAEDGRGCKSETHNMLEAFPLPVADFSFSPAFPKENYEPVYFTALSENQNISNWNWQLNTEGSPKISSEHTQMAFETAGNYVVMLEVENEWGCKDTLAKWIEVVEDVSVYIPNAFTPNQDGLNDTFYPVLRGINLSELQVYNRWGEKIFSSNQILNTWDGTYGGEICKEDVYNYKLYLSDKNGVETIYTGSVMLYR